MSKTQKIVYWIATIWLSSGMVSTGVVQIIKLEEETVVFNNLGYPDYLMPLLGIWKLLGVIAILIPRAALLKEWAYAGFFFAMSGAFISHIAVGDSAIELIGPSLLMVLTAVSWYFRPANKKMIQPA